MLLKDVYLADETITDIRIQNGIIAAMGTDLPCGEYEDPIYLEGKTLLPSFVDLHCHWRTPGYEHKETLASGSVAAVAGGYTHVNLMPNTNPVCSSAAIALDVQRRVQEIGLCDATQTISITKDFDGQTLSHLAELPASLRFISEDGRGVQSANVMAKAFQIAKRKGLTIFSHAEDMEISPWDDRLAENLETIRNLHLAQYYNVPLHICHVSTKEAIAAIAQAKEAGAPVTCEVCPHHIFFNDEDDLFYRVNPPIREYEDVQALIEAILDGTVDAIATDHAPHTDGEKQNGAAGMVGLETAFRVCYKVLCKKRGMPLQQLSNLFSKNPAAILGLPQKKEIVVGAPADLTVVDLTIASEVYRKALHSKSTNTPFDKRILPGKIVATIKGGKMVFRDFD